MLSNITASKNSTSTMNGGVDSNSGGNENDGNDASVYANGSVNIDGGGFKNSDGVILISVAQVTVVTIKVMVEEKVAALIAVIQGSKQNLCPKLAATKSTLL